MTWVTVISVAPAPRSMTTHIDALAESGVLCTQAYVASPVCSPSRAGLMTGRDPRRFGYEGNLNQSAANYATRPSCWVCRRANIRWGITCAAGYATALIGKWHLGTGDGFHPNQRGFDYFCGMLVGSHGYFPEPDNNKLERNGQPLREFSSPYLTDFFTDEALFGWASRHATSRGFCSCRTTHRTVRCRRRRKILADSLTLPTRNDELTQR